QNVRGDEGVLERENGEPAPLGQKAQYSLTYLGELLHEVRTLADRHNPGVADEPAQGFEIAQVGVGGQTGQRVGVLTGPGGRHSGRGGVHDAPRLYRPGSDATPHGQHRERVALPNASKGHKAATSDRLGSERKKRSVHAVQPAAVRSRQSRICTWDRRLEGHHQGRGGISRSPSYLAS